MMGPLRMCCWVGSLLPEGVLLAILLGHLFFARILGFATGESLTRLLGSHGGCFDMKFDWIDLRPGLNFCDLAIGGFVWRNPAGYKKTPYFLQIKRLLLRF